MQSKKLLSLALLALLLTACGGQAPAQQPTAATQAAVGAAQPAAALTAAPATEQAAPAQPTAAAQPPAAQGERTIVVAMTADPGAINSAITTSGNTHFVADQIFNGLVGLDDQLNPVPELAASWDIGAGGKVYTFKLQPNVKWHDGQPFTSADVKFSFEQALLKFHSRTKAGLEKVLESIDTPDDGTVVFSFKQPYGPLLQRLDVVEAPIIPKHIYEGKDLQKDPANLQPIGTGPFKFVEYVKGDHVTLERNPDYFRAGLPHLDKVIFRIIPDANTATLALEQGEVDYLNAVQGSAIESIQQNSDLVLARVWWLWWLGVPGYADPQPDQGAVRQAGGTPRLLPGPGSPVPRGSGLLWPGQRLDGADQ
jgi:peptide/nickel transport system substrate-binding protein